MHICYEIDCFFDNLFQDKTQKYLPHEEIISSAGFFEFPAVPDLQSGT